MYYVELWDGEDWSFLYKSDNFDLAFDQYAYFIEQYPGNEWRLISMVIHETNRA